MQIPADQVAKKDVVGKLDGDDVVHIAFRGGLNAIVRVSAGHSKPIAFGPHVAVAKHLARKYEPKISWTGLKKSEDYPLSSYEHLLPRWEAFSDQARTAAGV